MSHTTGFLGNVLPALKVVGGAFVLLVVTVLALFAATPFLKAALVWATVNFWPGFVVASVLCVCALTGLLAYEKRGHHTTSRTTFVLATALPILTIATAIGVYMLNHGMPQDAAYQVLVWLLTGVSAIGVLGVVGGLIFTALLIGDTKWPSR